MQAGGVVMRIRWAELLVCSLFLFPTLSDAEPSEVRDQATGHAYVSNAGDHTLAHCRITNTGHFTDCQITPDEPQFQDPQGLVLDPEKEALWLLDRGEESTRLFACPIDTDGNLTTCKRKGTKGQLMRFLAFHPVKHALYLSPLLHCALTPDNNLGVCDHTGLQTQGTFGIAIDSSGVFAFISDWEHDRVLRCVIRDDGGFEYCRSVGKDFHTPQGITVDPVKDRLYVTNWQGHSVTVCDITSRGSLRACEELANPQFHYPLGIAVDGNSQYAYVTNFYDNTVTVCELDDTGAFETCNTAGKDFYHPVAIAIHSPTEPRV